MTDPMLGWPVHIPEERPPVKWGAFPEPPWLEMVDLCEAFLVRPFAFVDRDGCVWEAPAGMRFDGTSVPSFLWSLFRESPFTGYAAWPGIIHDAGCKGKLTCNGARLDPGGFRDGRVHALFHAGIMARGANPLKAWLFYRAVWIVGMIWGGYSK